MSFPLRTRTRGRPSRNAGVVNVAAAPSFNPLTGWTTDPVHGVWASDPLWTPPADGGAVSSWRNGGTVGGDPVQATGSKQPTYRASTAAFNNQPTVQFDGTDDLVAAFVPGLPQPFWVVAIGSFSEGEDVIVGWTGNADNGMGRAYGQWILAGDTGKSTAGAMTAGTPYMLVGYLNGASSTMRINATTSTASNAGTTAGDRFTVGSNTNMAYSLSGHAAYVAVFTTDPTSQAEWATFTAWVLTTYGITVAP